MWRERGGHADGNQRRQASPSLRARYRDVSCAKRARALGGASRRSPRQRRRRSSPEQVAVVADDPMLESNRFGCRTLGSGFGDRFKSSQGDSGFAEGGVRDAGEVGNVQGKRADKQGPAIPPPRVESSMVRRGSTVRVRQRALQSPCKSPCFLPVPLAESTTWGRYGAVMEPPGSERRRLSREIDALRFRERSTSSARVAAGLSSSREQR
jgi:hypothetical protein